LIQQGRLQVRKLFLITAFALASVSVQAGERIDRVPATDDAPAAAVIPAAAPPATADTAKPQASRKQASGKQAFRNQAFRKQMSSGSRKTQARRETDEQKARRIAAEYGISW
jgi:type IV secretory pathway VirB10-like protein